MYLRNNRRIFGTFIAQYAKQYSCKNAIQQLQKKTSCGVHCITFETSFVHEAGGLVVVVVVGGVGGVIHHVSAPDWHLTPNMLNWVYVWTPSWPVHGLNILLVQKGCCVMCCMGRGIVLDVRKVTSPPPPSPVHGSIHHDQLTPPSMVDCTPYHDWRATVSIISH